MESDLKRLRADMGKGKSVLKKKPDQQTKLLQAEKSLAMPEVQLKVGGPEDSEDSDDQLSEGTQYTRVLVLYGWW